RATALFPTNPVFCYLQGLGLYRLEKTDEAIAVLEKGTKSGFSNVYLEADFYQMLAELHHQQGNNDVSDAYYDKVLVIMPDDVSVMNNYAYSLAGRGVKLEKALAMSRRTVDKEPKNPYYLDTYAWVLYKMGRYKEAERYILLAIKYSEKEDNRTNYEHYVEILGALGKKDEAEIVTKKYLAPK
ncbi:MAG: tetratricopeptide repeat protein, partial [Bacteroidales bacterium]|nr:tetratricopeptide repeat protein [Bacteroidales bacterium]